MALAFAVTLAVGCGSSGSGAPADFSGQYSGTSTNGMSSCPGQWNMGQMADGQFNLVQTGADVRFDAQGATGLVLFAIYGTATFSGQVSGNHIDAAIVGSVNNTLGECVFTWRGALTADLAGDKLEGILTSTPNTNGHADCDTVKVTGCSRATTFSYTRAMR
jgi:hypothetical protein